MTVTSPFLGVGVAQAIRNQDPFTHFSIYTISVFPNHQLTHIMCQIKDLARMVSTQAETLSKSWHENDAPGLSSCEIRRTNIPPLDTAGEEARNQLITTLRNLEQLVLGPKDTMQGFYYKVSVLSWSVRF